MQTTALKIGSAPSENTFEKKKILFESQPSEFSCRLFERKSEASTAKSKDTNNLRHC